MYSIDLNLSDSCADKTAAHNSNLRIVICLRATLDLAANNRLVHSSLPLIDFK